MKEIEIKFKKIDPKGVILLVALIMVTLFAMWTRMGTYDTKTILDYDPHYFYRIAKMILDNGYKAPEWDLQSFFPPGRPPNESFGWAYTIIILFKILEIFGFTFLEAAKLSSVIFVGMSVIVGYLFGKKISGSAIGGLATGLFVSLTPTLIGVSMAGYCDTDVAVVFYTLLAFFSIILVLEKPKIYYYIFAVLANAIFIYNWWFGWYIPLLFIALIPALVVYKIFLKIMQKEKFDIKKILKETEFLWKPIAIIIVALNIISLIFGWDHILIFLLVGSGFTGGAGGNIVNVSVAELQPISIFTKAGFMSIAGRVGMGPTVLFLVGLPSIIIYKLIKKIEINYMEIMMVIWASVTFWLILHGVRFSLLFSCATSVAAGYVIGSLIVMLKKNIIAITIYGIIGISVLMFVSDSMAIANQSRAMEVGGNWIDMLDWLKDNADEKAIVSTWWDPGHILASYTGLRVHADGAHCSDTDCIPYHHNVRIQDMGRIMSTNDEQEAVDILEKYMGLTEEQCNRVKNEFGEKVPEEACEPASEMYFISSSDLIGKFTWMNYFGGYRAPISDQNSFTVNPGVCCAATPKTEPGQISCGEFADQGRGVWVWCPWMFNLETTSVDQDQNPVYIYDYSGLKMVIIQKPDRLIPVYLNNFVINYMVYYQNDEMIVIDNSDLETQMQKIDGMVWVDPGFRTMIYFAPPIKDSVFARTFFFDGEGLEHFEQVFKNGEIRLYRVNFD